MFDVHTAIKFKYPLIMKILYASVKIQKRRVTLGRVSCMHKYTYTTIVLLSVKFDVKCVKLVYVFAMYVCALMRLGMAHKRRTFGLCISV